MQRSAANSSDLVTLAGVRFGFADRPGFLGPVDLRIGPSECWAIVGPNGAGKTTLLRLMAGLLRLGDGEIHICGRKLDELAHRQRARLVAMLPQTLPTDLDFLVRQIVLMGRYPHRSLGLFDTADDWDRAEQAMKLTDVLALADRRIGTLSGGEAQRVHVAAALAQDPVVLLADEPTASLDIQHQLAIFRILRRHVEAQDRAVAVVTHDVNLAAHFCTHVLLMDRGRPVASGPADQVLTPEVLSPVYNVSMTVAAACDQNSTRWVVPDFTTWGDPR